MHFKGREKKRMIYISDCQVVKILTYSLDMLFLVYTFAP